MSNYLKTVLLYFFSLTLLVLVINYVVNPFGLLNSPSLEGINSKKTQAHTRSRTLKAYEAIEYEADILLVGNSRVELGLNPEHPAFEGKRVYNLGLPGADINMQSHYAYNAIQNSNTKEIIMSIDFVDFLYTKERKYRQDPITYTPRLKTLLSGTTNTSYHWTKFKDYFAALFSLDALIASATTISSQNSSLSYIRKNGRMEDLEFFSIVNNEGIGILFDQKENTLEKKFSRSGWVLVREGTDSSHYFELFTQFIKHLQEDGIKVRLFISPYHENYLKILTKTSMYNNFRLWKRLLVKHLTEIDYFESGILWDFSTLNQYNQELIPPRNKKGVFMEWYWEPAHYRWQLGHKILDALILNKNVWGVPLIPKAAN